MSYLAFDALTSNVTLTLGNKIPNFIMGDGSKSHKSKRSKNKKKHTNPNPKAEEN
jgi:hypothetical protein